MEKPLPGPLGPPGQWIEKPLSGPLGPPGRWENKPLPGPPGPPGQWMEKPLPGPPGPPGQWMEKPLPGPPGPPGKWMEKPLPGPPGPPGQWMEKQLPGPPGPPGQWMEKPLPGPPGPPGQWMEKPLPGPPGPPGQRMEKPLECSKPWSYRTHDTLSTAEDAAKSKEWAFGPSGTQGAQRKWTESKVSAEARDDETCGTVGKTINPQGPPVKWSEITLTGLEKVVPPPPPPPPGPPDWEKYVESFVKRVGNDIRRPPRDTYAWSENVKSPVAALSGPTGPPGQWAHRDMNARNKEFGQNEQIMAASVKREDKAEDLNCRSCRCSESVASWIDRKGPWIYGTHKIDVVKLQRQALKEEATRSPRRSGQCILTEGYLANLSRDEGWRENFEGNQNITKTLSVITYATDWMGSKGNISWQVQANLAGSMQIF
ncbi:collagen alpha-1(XXV) chain [Elysia marginata]|uniref:Collagen alpha-1(XXV) chain n=1 Tax=Elysia marginata TaxID=1093978 RepID=A0AAV4H9M7_9GAST|nr:collagen alpha-1(XXV) chain [Elysia marginata]